MSMGVYTNWYHGPLPRPPPQGEGRVERLRAAGPWTDMRLLRRHAAIDHQFRAGDPG
jgi:hypothetical protein